MEYRNTLINDRFDPTPYAERVNELLAKMTVAEKIGQLNLEFTRASTELSEYNPEVDEGSEAGFIQKIRSGAAGSLL